MHKVILFAFIFIFSAGFVGAVDVAYVSDSSQANVRIAGILDDLDLSYDVIRNSNIRFTDFSDYKLLLIADDVSREEFLPFEEKNSIFFHGGIADEVWNINPGRTTRSLMKSIDLLSFVYDGVNVDLATNEIRVYSSSSEMHYLTVFSGNDITRVGLSTGNSPRPSIAYSVNDNNEDTVKTFFFGAPVFSEWTQDSEKIFRNAVEWTLAEIDEDNDGWRAAEDCNDNDASINPGAEEIPYDGIDQDCSGSDLTDVDEDGFDSDEVAGGSDCDDDNASVYPGNSDKALNCVNDAPEIISYIPVDNVVRAVENSANLFSVVANDFDSGIDIAWILDGVKQSAIGSEFLLSKPKGVYSLEVLVSDEDSDVSKFWTVIFGPVSDFTCSEVGGEVCSENTVCGGNLLEVGNTSACCTSSCIPEFDDADSCEIIDEGIGLEIKEVGDGDETLEIGENIRVEFEVRNDLGEDQKIDVELYLYNLDEGETVYDVSSKADISNGRVRIFRLNLEIPEDADPDDNYVVFLRADGKDSCNQVYEDVDIDRPDDLVIISELDFPSDAICGETIRGRIRVENVGEDEQDVELVVKNRDLDFSFDMDFELEAFGEDDSFAQGFDIDIPEDTENGKYVISARVVYGSNSDSLTKSINVQCGQENIFGSSIVVPGPGSLTLNEGGQVVQRIIDGIVKPNYGLIASIAMLNFMIVASLGVLYLSWLKKKKKSRR